MGVPGILFIRTSPTLLVFGLLIGALNFRATESFRRRAGISPWRIHPVIWAAASVFVSLVITVLAMIAIRTTRVPGSGGQISNGLRGFDRRPETIGGTRKPGGLASPGGAPTLATPALAATVSPPSWHPDPSGVHQHRYWDGRQWTEYVSTNGVTGIDPPPAA